MKKIVIFLIVALTMEYSSAQIDNLTILKSALAEGQEMINAFQIGDFDTFIQFNHPKLVEMSGGKNKMKQLFNGQKTNRELEGMLISTELSLPKKLITTEGIYQCAIPQKQIFKIDGKKYFNLSTLIGISENEGKQWYFIAATKPLNELQTVFPELSSDLDVIELKAPVLLIE